MEPELIADDKLSMYDIVVENDNYLDASYIFKIMSQGENTPIAQMRFLAADELVLHHIPAPTEVIDSISEMVVEGIHIYCGDLISNFTNQGLGLATWLLAEKMLIEKEKRLIRYISDKSPAFWTSRHLDYTLGYLENTQSVKITPLYTTFSQDTPEYIFLFEK